MTTRYIPHLISATLLTSLSMHLLMHRKGSQDERATLDARISVLESLVARVKSGENVSDREIQRLKNLGRGSGSTGLGVDMGTVSESLRSTGWRDMVLGKKPVEDPAATRELESGEQSLQN
ncbi:hypothetical protein SISSUDRAFT_981165 [Sistotremastrum suecicum HHB10207 ss-3]|uniref:Uncharacterized protein n=1 Tax=Sistotremastrum suecicum HHB10207 ss-3 TaxID=1314776 RepID=A0A166GS71_9AGAM|nr:hypothetical protein SISSUDRAFT_981165 [Sistotremastrum suecicum HHB10207 ss-3]